MKKLLFALGIVVGVFLALALSAHAATVLFPTGGGTGTSTPPSLGQLLVGNSGGTYTLTATSSLGLLTNITGLISQGTNVTITGSGTSGSPYVINASGGGGGSGTISTSSPLTAGLLVQSTGVNTIANIATSSLGLLTNDVTEGTNLYWTNVRFDTRLGATTTLPQITTLANLGTVKTSLSGILKASSGVLSAAISGTDYTLITAKTCTTGDFVSGVTAAGVFTCTTPSTSSGTVTSVALTTPTGLSISGSPITTNGTLALSLTAGYVIPLTASTTDWNTAYLNRITSATLPLSISGNAISIANAVADGSTKGAASFTANDFDASSGNISLDYTNGQKATASVSGFLSSTDWSTFNGKQSALTFSTGLTNTTGTVTVNTSQDIGTLSNLTGNGAVLTSGGAGTLGTYTGTSCANQFVRSLSGSIAASCATVGAADVSLAALTATDSTLTFSGSYTGATARTIGLNLANAQSWTGLQQFNANASTTSFTSTGNAFLATASGKVGIGTTTPASLLQLFSTGTTTLSVDSNSATQGSCIEMKDTSGGGYTYIYAQGGVIFTSTTSCK